MYNKFVFVFTNLLFHYCYPLYRFLYFIFKKKQDKFEMDLMKKLINEGDTVLDIGGNIGFYSMYLSNLAGESGKLHVFEPDKLNFKRLYENLRNRKNTILNNIAVSDKPGELKLYQSGILNVDHRVYAFETASKSYTVPANSIDNYLGENNKTDFIKIDIQGAEMQAYKGMQETLATNPQLNIIAEIFPKGLVSMGSSAQEVFDFFTSKGFSIFWINKEQLLEFPQERFKSYEAAGEFDFDNILITKKNIREII